MFGSEPAHPSPLLPPKFRMFVVTISKYSVEGLNAS